MFCSKVRAGKHFKLQQQLEEWLELPPGLCSDHDTYKIYNYKSGSSSLYSISQSLLKQGWEGTEYSDVDLRQKLKGSHLADWGMGPLAPHEQIM